MMAAGSRDRQWGGEGERVRFWIYLLEGRVSRIANVLDMTEKRNQRWFQAFQPEQLEGWSCHQQKPESCREIGSEQRPGKEKIP